MKYTSPALELVQDVDQRIFIAVLQERMHQDYKYGTPEERNLSLAAYYGIIRKELDEVGDAIGHLDADEAKLEILQVLAVCWACLEQHGVIERE